MRYSIYYSNEGKIFILLISYFSNPLNGFYYDVVLILSQSSTDRSLKHEISLGVMTEYGYITQRNLVFFF